MAVEQERPAIGSNQLGRIGILGRFDQLDLPIAQFVELLPVEPRPQQGVGQQLEHQTLVTREKLAADRDRFGPGRGVEAATDAFDRISELEGIALPRSLLEQAGDQGSDAGFICAVT